MVLSRYLNEFFFELFKIIMARRRYYRVRKVYPKQKWLPVNNEMTILGGTVLSGSYKITMGILTQNATRTDSTGGGNITSASITKCGRFKFKGVLIGNTIAGLNTIVGISYVPEGYPLDNDASLAVDTLGNSFFYKHPEWILCWTRLDFTAASQSNEVRLSSKLKRNLSSGDRIVLFKIDVNNTNTDTSIYPLIGTVSYVCRTN